MLKADTRQKLSQLAITIADREEDYYKFKSLVSSADNAFERNLYNLKQREISKEITTLSHQYDQLFKSGR